MYRYINTYTGVIYKHFISAILDTVLTIIKCKKCRTFQMFQFGRI